MAHSLEAQVTIALDPEAAFTRFTAGMGAWWPKAYSWSGEAMADMRIDPIEDGACSEFGPHGFRSDFGRVLRVEAPERVVFTWQISPRREPQPDPARASTVEVAFARAGEGTEVTLTHSGFDRHGEGAETYCRLMAGDDGWPYILACYATL